MILDSNGSWRPLPVRLLAQKPSLAQVLEHATLIAPSLQGLNEYMYELAERDPNAFMSRGVGSEGTAKFAASIAAWHLHGRQSMRVSPPLFDALRSTSLDHVPTALLRSPYPSMWIESGDEGFIVVDQRLLGFFLHESETGREPLFDPLVKHGILAPGVRVLGVGLFSVLSLHLSLYLTKPSLVESFDDSIRINDEVTRRWGHPECQLQDEAAFMREAFALVANLLLYLSSPDPDIQPVMPPGLGRPPKSAKARGIQETIRRREGAGIAVGYRLTRVTRPSQPQASADPASAASNSSPRVHLVRGHWKRQPHGPSLSERKVIWVAPYRRGDDGMEETLERTYDL